MRAAAPAVDWLQWSCFGVHFPHHGWCCGEGVGVWLTVEPGPCVWLTVEPGPCTFRCVGTRSLVTFVKRAAWLARPGSLRSGRRCSWGSYCSNRSSATVKGVHGVHRYIELN